MMNLGPQELVPSSEGDVGRDRLSELPDEVLVNILSFMPTVDAVGTVLLRRFGELWRFIHNFQFDLTYIRRDEMTYSGFTECVLLLTQLNSIDRFELCVVFDNDVEREKAVRDLRVWFIFALDRQAKEIRFSIRLRHSISCTMYVPKLTSQFLVTLDLAYCYIERKTRVKLGSLKKLSLTCVYLDDGVFQSLISGCPSLQELVIREPCGLTDVTFSAPNIDKLALVFDVEVHGENSLALNTPNLKRLYLDIYTNEVDIIDVSSVRDIYVNHVSSRYADEAFPFTTKLLAKLESVEVFRLSLDFSKIFLRLIPNLELLPNRWKRIVLELDDFCESSLLGIYHLMTSLQHFEKLIIYTTENFKASADLQQVELPSPYVPPQLKTITLHGYGETWKSQLLLIEFFLKSAAVLDKFVIVPMEDQLKIADELKFVKHVSSFPRASSSARVIFA